MVLLVNPMFSLSKRPVEFVSSSIARVNASSNTVTAPTGILDDDLLVAYMYQNSVNRTFTYPSGFSQRFLAQNASVNDATLGIATKIAASESGNYTFSSSQSGSIVCAVLVYRNAKDIDRLIGGVTGADSATATAASISPTDSGALLAFFSMNRSTTIATPPSGMTQRAVSTGSVPTTGIYDITPNGSGATGDKVLVFSDSNKNSGILMQVYQK
jgi:hypothetical protein